MPKRWTPLRPHPEQARLWTEQKRFKVVAAGRRSGKTELAKRHLVAALTEKKPWRDSRYFAAAPTREQAKRIFWKDLKALTPTGWIKKISETELSIATRFGSELWVVGLDRPQRIEGTPWDGCVLDEYADMKEGAWTENVRPALSDRGGWCWFVGVPEGLNHFKDLADRAGSGEDPDWGFYTWHSADILPPKEVLSARRTLDPRTFRQEYEASFEASTARVYYAYRRELHLDEDIRVSAEFPIILACDFNVDPCVWELLQTDGVKAWVFDEVALKNTNTFEMARAALFRYGAHKKGFVCYGDAAGQRRTTTGKSDYAILHAMGFTNQRIKRQNPPLKDRVNAVNALLSNAFGEVRLTLHPRCVYLKRDLETVEWNVDSTSLDKTDGERTHATDALGYFVEREFPLRILKKDPDRRFYK